MPAQRQPLPGARWHFQHGPIDLVIGAEGEPAAVAAAHEAAWQRFATVLDELVAELPLLRQPLPPPDDAAPCPLQGVVARRMWQACAALRADFITPMAAVAGAVAEEMVAAYRVAGLQRAWVNNGGDIALHLAEGESLQVGVVAEPLRATAGLAAQGLLGLDGRFTLHHASPVRGVATSGWGGRSFSLGIADSVTVLAATAAAADAAATLVANAVNIEDARIQRRPAQALKDDADLGARRVTVQVPPLPAALCAQALENGLAQARRFQAAGLIEDAVLVCQGQVRVLGTPLPRLGGAGA